MEFNRGDEVEYRPGGVGADWQPGVIRGEATLGATQFYVVAPIIDHYPPSYSGYTYHYCVVMPTRVRAKQKTYDVKPYTVRAEFEVDVEATSKEAAVRIGVEQIQESPYKEVRFVRASAS